MATITITTQQAFPLTATFTDARERPCAPLKTKVSISNPKVLQVVSIGNNEFMIEAKRVGKSRLALTAKIEQKILRRWFTVIVVKPSKQSNAAIRLTFTENAK